MVRREIPGRFERLKQKARNSVVIGGVSLIAACTATPEDRPPEPTRASTMQTEPNFSNPQLPACDYDTDSNPETLSPGEAFISAAKGEWVAPDGTEAYMAPILVKQLFPGETNLSASLKPYHVNGGPFSGGRLPLYPIDTDHYRDFRWQGTRVTDDIHALDTCYDADPNVHRNPRVTTRVYKVPGQAELFTGQMAPYPSANEVPKFVPHAELSGNEAVSGLYIVGAAEIAAAGIRLDGMRTTPPFQGR